MTATPTSPSAPAPLELVVTTDADAPATLRASVGGRPALRDHPLVEVLTLAERNDRMTQSPVGSTVGARLRPVRRDDADDRVVVEQRDPVTGLRVTTTIEVVAAAPAVRIRHELRNDGDRDVRIADAPALSVRTAAPVEAHRLVTGRSEWLGEGRWEERPLARVLPDLGYALVAQPDRGGYGQVSTGGWSTGSVLPTAVLAADAVSLAWQIETSAGWSWNLSRGTGGVTLTAGGPDDRHHDAAVHLAPGDAFTTEPAALALAAGGRDAAVAALTRHRRAIRLPRDADRESPVVYNDYMNTLMGQPSTAALLPLVAAAAEAGAEVFCIDAGWFTDTVDYWSEVGEWRAAPTRFEGGLDAVIDAIRAAGMRPGLWLEPEAVGLDSPVAGSLPDDAFFVRDGEPVVQQRRRHLDLRDPRARAHLDETVDHLVERYGVAFLKLDYNIEPGVGTDAGGATPGAGLLGHARALRDWIVGVQERHPALLVENCASGAMRMDYHLLSATHLQSTSDQQDAVRYAAIASAAPLSLLPEQAGNWAYPAVGMSRGETVTTLVNGLAGRLYLAGFLDRLDADRRALVREAVDVFGALRAEHAASVPFWPLGLPEWDADVLALGLERPDGTVAVAVWSRGGAGEVALDGVAGLERVFPRESVWTADGAVVRHPAGPDAAVFVGRRVADAGARA
jgi:alpha-galactosidase